MIWKISAWKDVREKAKTIFRNGGVYNVELFPKNVKDVRKARAIKASILSTTGNEYRSSILFYGGSDKIMTWTCTCEWSKYVWNRTPPYKHLEGRPCSHVYALYLFYQSERLKGEWRKWKGE